MVPIMVFSKIRIFEVSNITVKIVLNMLFLSVFASVACFIMWNKAVSIIGSVKTTNYIYFVPLITIIASVVVLEEEVSPLMLLGGFFILIGVYVTQSKILHKFK
jgi:drug/metabolite transporter (DMT)-like permease